MEITNNYSTRSSAEYEVRFNKEEQEIIGEAYAWHMANMRQGGEASPEETLPQDFALMAMMYESNQLDELLDEHKAYMTGNELQQAEPILVGYQRVVRQNDRPVISEDRSKFNKRWPDHRAGQMASTILNKLAFVQMNTRQDDVPHMAPLPKPELSTV